MLKLVGKTMNMDIKKAISFTLELMDNYCKKNIDSLFTHMDEKAVFIGPRTGQFFSSGTSIRNAWSSGAPMTDFILENIRTFAIPLTAMSCEVICMYTVIWKKDDCTVIRHPQTLQASWILQPSAAATEEEDSAYRIVALHISNPIAPDERDLQYNTFGDMATSALSAGLQHSKKSASTRILIPAPYGTVYSFPSGSVVWIESASGGHQSVVHARNTSLRSSRPLSYFSERYPDIFLKPSVSYMVNPLYIRKIRRCEIDLWNNVTLRVPEKKYTAFKKQFLSLMKETHAD